MPFECPRSLPPRATFSSAAERALAAPPRCRAQEFEEAVDYALSGIVDDLGFDEDDAEDDAEGRAVEALLEMLEQHHSGELERASLHRVALKAYELASRGQHGLRTEAWVTPSAKPAVHSAAKGGNGAKPAAASAAARMQPAKRAPAPPSSPPPQQLPPVSPKDMAMLQELKPGVSEALCAFVLRKCAGSSSEAAEMLFTVDEAKLEAEWQAASAAAEAQAEALRKEQARADKDARKRAIGRNDAVRDYAADGETMQLTAPRLPYAKTRKDSLADAKGARYLDGQVVAHKSADKYITVGEKEEWDGGSRGKVKTKGKRGPAYQ